MLFLYRTWIACVEYMWMWGVYECGIMMWVWNRYMWGIWKVHAGYCGAQMYYVLYVWVICLWTCIMSPCVLLTTGAVRPSTVGNCMLKGVVWQGFDSLLYALSASGRCPQCCPATHTVCFSLSNRKVMPGRHQRTWKSMSQNIWDLSRNGSAGLNFPGAYKRYLGPGKGLQLCERFHFLLDPKF